MNIALLSWKIYITTKVKLLSFAPGVRWLYTRPQYIVLFKKKHDNLWAILRPHRQLGMSFFPLVLKTNDWLVFNSASWSKSPYFTVLYDSWLHFWEVLSLRLSSVSTSEVSFRGYVLWSLSSFVKLLPDAWGLRLF